MRRLILLALMTALVPPAGAAKRVTVAQLEQFLIDTGAAHKRDAEIARQITALELSERLTEATLSRLNTHLTSEPEATLALRLLADQSEFLDPPPGELPSTDVPGGPAQLRMLASARSYVAQALPRLPNFLATRTINRYDDSPQAPKKGAWPVRAGLHLVDTSKWEISVRDERENQPPAAGSAVWKQQIGLISGGEFGSTLGMILTDTLQGKVTWSHWEQTSAGQTAVFRYSVPRSASHFEIMGSREGQAALEGHATSMGGARGVSGIGVTQSAVGSSNPIIIRTKPGYHGSIWLDPESGTILRVTMEADSKDSASFRQAAILVQYGPVRIGDSNFICPVRSLALSSAASGARFDPLDRTPTDAPTQWLNETLFTGYHRFASTSEIIPNGATPQ